MAAISLRGREDASAFVAAFAGSHRFVFDYLLEQVLNRQTPEVREFLLKTSVLERLSAPLCDAVAETDGAARRLLDTLERANLFLVPLDDERELVSLSSPVFRFAQTDAGADPPRAWR